MLAITVPLTLMCPVWTVPGVVGWRSTGGLARNRPTPKATAVAERSASLFIDFPTTLKHRWENHTPNRRWLGPSSDMDHACREIIASDPVFDWPLPSDLFLLSRNSPLSFVEVDRRVQGAEMCP